LAADLYALEKQPEGLIDILREPYFVPETKSASDLFRTFRKRMLSVALVVDEYGGITGLISMEDLMECIFGDIPSPSDITSGTDMAVTHDGSRQVDGSLTIAQFNEEFGAALAEGEYETVGGCILHELGELPEEGTSITMSGFSFTVQEVDANRLKTLSVRELVDKDTIMQEEQEEQEETIGGESK